jgi:hypothetical protein
VFAPVYGFTLVIMPLALYMGSYDGFFDVHDAVLGLDVNVVAGRALPCQKSGRAGTLFVSH